MTAIEFWIVLLILHLVIMCIGAVLVEAKELRDKERELQEDNIDGKGGDK